MEAARPDPFQTVLGAGRGRPEEMTVASRRPGPEARAHARELRLLPGALLGPAAMSALHSFHQQLDQRPLLRALYDDALATLVKAGENHWRKRIEATLFALALCDGHSRDIFMLDRELHRWEDGWSAPLTVRGLDVALACGRAAHLTPDQRAPVRLLGHRHADRRCEACFQAPGSATSRRVLGEGKLDARARMRLLLDAQLRESAPSRALLRELAREGYRLGFLDYVSERCASEGERIGCELGALGPAQTDWRELAAWLLRTVCADAPLAARCQAARSYLLARLHGE